MRFFFCHFLAEYVAELFLLLAAVRRLSNLDFTFLKIQIGGNKNGIKVLRECGVDEAVIEQIRIEDRADFNSNRRFYRWTSDFWEYLEGLADTEQQAEPNTVADLLDEIEDEKLYQALLTVDKHTLLILLLKMQGYSTREIAAMTGLTERAVYKRLERLRKKLKPIFYPFGEI